LSVRQYDSPQSPKALIIFGSGDGGWKIWEERACRALALAGFRVIGWDTRLYANRRFDAVILGNDLQKMAKSGQGTNGPSIPVIYGGYSTGAEQSVAAAAWNLKVGKKELNPEALLLVAPGKRGRFGITAADLIGITPRGEGSFALSDMAPAIAEIPVAQIHGTHDPLDSTDWLSLLKAPHRLYSIDGAWHSFGDADEELQRTLVEAARWILQEISDQK